MPRGRYKATFERERVLRDLLSEVWTWLQEQVLSRCSGPERRRIERRGLRKSSEV